MSSKTLVSIGLLMLISGAVFDIGNASLGGAYLAAIGLLGYWYSHACLKHIHYTRKFESTRAFLGDSVGLEISVENRKPLPVLAISCLDEVPDKRKIGSIELEAHSRPGRSILKNKMHIGSFQRVERRFTINCLSRGSFRFGPVSLRCIDPIGTEATRATLDTVDTLLVYPRLQFVRGLPFPRRDPSGGVPDRGWINPDPTQIVGVKPYYSGVPMNQIAWKQTAKSGSLKSRMIMPSFHSQAIVCMSVSTSGHAWEGIDSDSLESVVSISASLCNSLLNQGIPFGFASNVPGNKRQRHLFIPPGLSMAHLRYILDHLANIFIPWGRFSETLTQVSGNVSENTEIVAVMPKPSLTDWVALRGLSSKGLPVSAVVLEASPEHGEFLEQIPVFKPIEPVDWLEGEVITLERLVSDCALISK